MSFTKQQLNVFYVMHFSFFKSLYVNKCVFSKNAIKDGEFHFKKKLDGVAALKIKTSNSESSCQICIEFMHYFSDTSISFTNIKHRFKEINHL